MPRRDTIALAVLSALAIWLLCALCIHVLEAQPTAPSYDKVVISEVRWDPAKCVLAWRAERGGKRTKFVIDFHADTMTDGKRSFKLSAEEQLLVHAQMSEALTGYPAASVVWFDRGGVYAERPPDELRMHGLMPPPDSDAKRAHGPVPPPDPDVLPRIARNNGAVR